MVNVLGTAERLDGAVPVGDWTVDGRVLGAWAERWTAEGPRARRNGYVRTEDPVHLHALLGGRTPLRSGRVPLYVCSQCGDLTCGVFAVGVGRDGKGRIIWTDWAMDGGTDSPRGDPAAPDADFADVPVLTFDPDAYERTVRGLLGI